MPYSIVYSKRALRDLRKIASSDQIWIIEKLESIVDDPFVHVKRLKNLPFFSLRVGDYRILLDIQRKRLLILVLTAGHRKNVYE